MSRLGWIILRAVGLVVLAVILWQLDYGKLWSLLAEADPLPMGITLALVPVSLAAKAVRWHVLLRELDIRIPLRQSLFTYMAGIFMGLVTPGKLGEFSRSAYLKQSGAAGLAESLSSQVIDRLYDLQMLGLMVWVGFIWMGSAVAPALPWVGWIGLAVNLGVVGTVFLLPDLRRRTSRRIGSALLKRLPERLHLPGKTMFASLSALMRPKALPGPVLLTLLSYAILLVQIWLIAMAVGLDVPLAPALLAVMMANLLSLLPITVAGFGTREGALLVLLGPYDATNEQIVLYSLGVFFVFYIGGAAVGIVGWLLAPTYAGTRARSADARALLEQTHPELDEQPTLTEKTANAGSANTPTDPSSA